MRVARHGLACVAVALFAHAGCYESHGLRGLAPSGADAGVLPRLDAGAAPDAGADAATRPCAFTPIAPWQLTEPPGDQALHAVAALPEGFLVAWASSNDPPPLPDRFVRRVTLRGPDGPTRALFGASRGPFLGGVGLAVGPRGGLASVWDGRGCRVRPFALDGRPTGTDLPLGIPSCAGVHARSAGFGLFERPGAGGSQLHELSRDGAILRSGPRIALLDGAFWWASVASERDARLVLAMSPGVEPTAAQATTIDRDGVPSEHVAMLPSFAAASRVRAAPTPRGALVAWLEQPEGDAGAQERVVVAFPIGADGAVLDPPRALTEPVAFRDAGLSLDSDGARVWLAYVEAEPGERRGDATRLVVLALDASGRVEGRHVLDEGRFLRTPIVRASAEGVLVAYAKLGDALPRQVFVTGLECR